MVIDGGKQYSKTNALNVVKKEHLFLTVVLQKLNVFTVDLIMVVKEHGGTYVLNVKSVVVHVVVILME